MKVDLAFATSRKNAGEYLFRVHPNLRGMTDMQFIDNDVSKMTGMADLVFTALPHGESLEVHAAARLLRGEDSGPQR